MFTFHLRKKEIAGFFLVVIFIFGSSACNFSQPVQQTQATATISPAIVVKTEIPPTPTITVPEKKSVIIDTDMAADDWIAILYTLKRTDVEVKAISVSGTGEAHCEMGIRNARRLLKLVNQESIPVACGRTTPLKGGHVFPDSWRQYVDGFAGLSLPEGNAPVEPKGSVALINRIVTSSKNPVTLLTLGPLTNIADAFLTYPEIKKNITAIYIMGGAVEVPGNVGTTTKIENPYAEWNIYIDPYADNVVLSSGVPINLIAMDATNQVPVTQEFFDRLEKDHSAPASDFLYALYQSNPAMLHGGYYFWDHLTAVALTEKDVVPYRDYTICVVEDEGSESGRTKIEDGCPTVHVAVGADKEMFESLLLDTLAQ